MDETIPQNEKKAKVDWIPILSVGLAIGLAVPVHRAVLTNLEPQLGYWWALACSLSAAAAVGALASVPFVLYRWLQKRSNGRAL